MLSAAFVLPTAVSLGYLAAVSVPLAVTDARTGRLPNSLTVPGLLLTAWALLAAFLAGLPLDATVGLLGLTPWGESRAAVVAADAPAGLGAAAAVVAVLGTGWAAGLVGMGDVKLGAWLGAMAGMLGMSSHPAALAQGAAAGAVVVTALLVAALIGGGPTAASRLPLGPPALAAFWAATARLLLP
jgi:leader peptidase (prepilin peptidase)/N-methyltransferase